MTLRIPTLQNSYLVANQTEEWMHFICIALIKFLLQCAVSWVTYIFASVQWELY